MTTIYSSTAGDERGAERERSELEERFKQLRPEILDTLRTSGVNYRHLALFSCFLIHKQAEMDAPATHSSSRSSIAISAASHRYATKTPYTLLTRIRTLLALRII